MAIVSVEGNGAGVIRSSDGGNHWTPLFVRETTRAPTDFRFSFLPVYQVRPFDSVVSMVGWFAVVDQAPYWYINFLPFEERYHPYVYRTRDNGVSWQEMFDGVQSEVVAEGPSYFALGNMQEPIQYSRDGATWTDVRLPSN